RRRHTRSTRDWSSDVCSSDLAWRRRRFERGKLRRRGRGVRPTVSAYAARCNRKAAGAWRVSLKLRIKSRPWYINQRREQSWGGRSEERRVGTECRVRRWAERA